MKTVYRTVTSTPSGPNIPPEPGSQAPSIIFLP
jgi:hypothetical protein